jgi:hypothetical protein
VKTTFRSLPAGRYPFTVRLFDAATRKLRWQAEVPGPGALRIPGRAEINDGRPLIAQITWPDGTATVAGPPDGDPICVTCWHPIGPSQPRHTVDGGLMCHGCHLAGMA